MGGSLAAGDGLKPHATKEHVLGRLAGRGVEEGDHQQDGEQRPWKWYEAKGTGRVERGISPTRSTGGGPC